MNKTFSPRFRLHTKADFFGFHHGFRLNSGHLRLICRSNVMRHARLGLAVSRKYGNAVRRNRLKRRLRECFRLSDIRYEGVDILVMPLCNWKKIRDVNRDMDQGLRQIVRRRRRDRT